MIMCVHDDIEPLRSSDKIWLFSSSKIIRWSHSRLFHVWGSELSWKSQFVDHLWENVIINLNWVSKSFRFEFSDRKQKRRSENCLISVDLNKMWIFCIKSFSEFFRLLFHAPRSMYAINVIYYSSIATKRFRKTSDSSWRWKIMKFNLWIV